MVGIVVIAHAPLASALTQCAEHVYSCEPSARRELRALDVDDSADLRTRWHEHANWCTRSITAKAC